MTDFTILITNLEAIANGHTSLRQVVAQEVLNHEPTCINDITIFFTDLFTHGCISGMIGSLIYYYDTRKLYDDHYFEIEELRQEYEESVGQSLHITGDLKNSLAWFAFEETARQFSYELELVI